MKTILPPDAYVVPTTPFVRIGLMGGLLFATFIALGFATLLHFQARSTQEPILPVVLVAAALGGILFGGLFPLILRTTLSRFMRQAHRGEGRLATRPPADRYTHRLPASLCQGALEIGGAVYVAQDSVAFVPHGSNLPRHRAVRELRGPSPFRARVVRRQPNAIQRFFLGKDLPPLVQLRCADEVWLLNVPQAEVVAAALTELLAQQ